MPEENTKQPDEAKQNDHLSLYKNIVDRAHDEILWVRSAYKLLGGFLIIVITAGFYFSYRSALDFKNELRAEGQTVQRRLEADMKSFRGRLEQKVNDRIEEQFGRDEIHSLVEVAAQKRIDAIGDDIIERQIAQRIDPIEKQFKASLGGFEANLKQLKSDIIKQIDEVEVKRAKLSATIVEVNQLLDLLNTQSEFIMTVIDASHDGRKAFKRLQSWADDDSFIFHNAAKQVAFVIIGKYVKSKPFIVTSWEEGLDKSNLNLEDLNSIASRLDSSRLTGFVNLVWKENEIPKSVRAAFLVDVMRGQGDSLHAANHANRLLSKEAKLTFDSPFTLKHIIAWWEENKDSLNEPAGDNEESK